MSEEIIKTLRSELKEIREVVEADENESTLDEVVRMKHKYSTVINTLKKTTVQLSAIKHDMLKKGVNFDNADTYNTIHGLILEIASL